MAAEVSPPGFAGEHLTGAEMAAELSKTVGEEVSYYAIPWDQYRPLAFPGAEDLGNMVQFKARLPGRLSRCP